MESYVLGGEKKTDNVFKVLDAGINVISRSVLPKEGILFICQMTGKTVLCGENGNKTLTDGDCFVGKLQKNYMFSENNCEDTKTVYFAVDGKLAYLISEMYGVSEGSVIKAPEAVEAALKICEITKDPELDEEEKREDAAIAFHRLLYKLRRASKLGLKRQKSTASEIKKYIDSHLEGKLTLEELSGMFFVSKTQIFRIFKETYGIAPIQYFLKQKIELSKEMLAKTEMHISEIAEALSFTDAKHFSKTFRKFSGELPRNFRREAKINKLKNSSLF